MCIQVGDFVQVEVHLARAKLWLWTGPGEETTWRSYSWPWIEEKAFVGHTNHAFPSPSLYGMFGLLSLTSLWIFISSALPLRLVPSCIGNNVLFPTCFEQTQGFHWGCQVFHWAISFAICCQPKQKKSLAWDQRGTGGRVVVCCYMCMIHPST